MTIFFLSSCQCGQGTTTPSTVKLSSNLIISNRITTNQTLFYSNLSTFYSNRIEGSIYTTDGAVLTNVFLSNATSNTSTDTFLSNLVNSVITNSTTNLLVTDIESNSYLRTNSIYLYVSGNTHITNHYSNALASTNQISNTNWNGWDFSSANFSNANMVSFNLQNANLTNANLTNAEVDFNTYLYLTDNQHYRHLGYISDDFQKALANDGAGNDRFGVSVSISGDYAIVGAHNDDDNGENSGSAYIFTRNSNAWSQQAKIKPNDGATINRFGISVSISGDYAIVGANQDDDNGANSGSAYIFTRNSNAWSQQAKIKPNDGAANDQFGLSVSISGDYAIVGADNDDDNGDDSGSAYIFTRNDSNWSQQTKIKPNDGTNTDGFGASVSISGDYAIVGSQFDDDNGSASGSAYIFTRNGSTWSQQTKIKPNDGTTVDRFGLSVSISGDYAIVGAIWDDDNGANSGSAYIFTRNSNAWSQQAKIKPNDGAANDQFGLSVSISGDYAIVGADNDDDNGDDSGSAYIFTRNDSNWSQQTKIKPNDGAAGDDFSSVSISGDDAIVGADNDDDNGSDSGSAYIIKYR